MLFPFQEHTHHAGPLLLVVATLLAYAVHERSPLLALGGSAVFQLAVALEGNEEQDRQ